MLFLYSYTKGNVCSSCLMFTVIIMYFPLANFAISQEE